MYSKSACLTTGDYDTFDNNNVCLRQKNPTPTTTGQFWKKKTVACTHCGSKKPVNAVGVRKEEVLAIRSRFPTKIPVIVQRYPKESSLPEMDKSKFLVPQEITVSQFQTIIRNRIKLNPNQALYLLVNNRSMMSLSLTLAEVYTIHAHCDGFLYITYASQDVFGNDDTDRKNYSDKKNCKRNVLMEF
ncbi:microtubule-associated proteins 1A/1B light chain 3C-like isoform X2 [Anoplophora glabripennis]|uniref:microtubule-associated proteins 1A/1B light chain 3C-like isoform X2 n=1 Tax=Anoplophora glabripennis TaxID=217634 RepID=UPI000873ECAA|nr:microtubule-associated proteins 1A/1B light chain 3C-like isoform X2 [Anoplophora glabripennis]